MHAIQCSRHARLIRSDGGVGAKAAVVHRRARSTLSAQSGRGRRDELRRTRGRGHGEADHHVAATRRPTLPAQPCESSERKSHDRESQKDRFWLLRVRGLERGGHHHLVDAAHHRGHTTARALQPHGHGDRVFRNALVDARLLGRTRLQARLRDLVPRGRHLGVVENSSHATWQHASLDQSTLAGHHVRVPGGGQQSAGRGHDEQGDDDSHAR
jgi:hypothetical protein